MDEAGCARVKNAHTCPLALDDVTGMCSNRVCRVIIIFHTTLARTWYRIQNWFLKSSVSDGRENVYRWPAVRMAKRAYNMSRVLYNIDQRGPCCSWYIQTINRTIKSEFNFWTRITSGNFSAAVATRKKKPF